MIVLKIFILFVSFISAQAKDACIEGFVMDKYCINLGVLLDNKKVVTLENPEKHSVHCLVDISLCHQSGYHILAPNPSGNPRFGYVVSLDEQGNNMAISLARAQGKCSTCDGSGTVENGFRATVVGELVQNSDDGPPTIKVKSISPSPRQFNESAPDGCPANTSISNLKLFTESGSFQNPMIAHGSLMIIGWGFLLPTGISAAHFLKHRPNALWFKIHRLVQVIGLVIALIGWITALVSFDALEGTGSSSFYHALMGMIVMILGLLQPVNAFIRPHPPQDGEEKPFKRLLWEIVHKSSGYIAVLLAAGTIAFGTFLIFGHNSVFLAIWIISLVWVISFSIYGAYDGHKNGS